MRKARLLSYNQCEYVDKPDIIEGPVEVKTKTLVNFVVENRDFKS